MLTKPLILLVENAPSGIAGSIEAAGFHIRSMTEETLVTLTQTDLLDQYDIVLLNCQPGSQVNDLLTAVSIPVLRLAAREAISQTPVLSSTLSDVVLPLDAPPDHWKPALTMACELSSARRQLRVKESELIRQAEVTLALNELYPPLSAPQGSIQDIALQVLKQALRVTGSQNGFVSEVDPFSGESIAYSLAGQLPFASNDNQQIMRVAFPPSTPDLFQGLWGHQFTSREAFFTNTPTYHPTVDANSSERLHLRAVLVVPVHLGDEVVGQIALANPSRDYTQADLDAIQRMAELYALAIQRKRAEAGPEKWAYIFEYAGWGVTTGEMESMHITLANPAMARMLGREGSELIGRPLTDFFLEEYRPIFTEQLQVAVRNGHSSWEAFCLRLDGSHFPAQVELSVAQDPRWQHLFWVANLRDISGRYRSRQALARNRELLDETGRIARVGGWELDIVSQELAWTEEIYRMYEVGQDFQPNLLNSGLRLSFESRQALTAAIANAVRTGEPFDLVLEMTTLKGSRRWIHSKGSRNPEQTKIVGTLQDITEQRQAELALEQAINERDLLMAELRHRVMNTLTIVSSLLTNETANLSDPQAREFLNATQLRIQSMAAIYDLLYRKGAMDKSHMDKVRMDVYVQSLVEALAQSYAPPDQKITVNAQTDEIWLDLKRAIPLGLIINELVVNAFKYAFPPGNDGKIDISLRQEGERIVLVVADNGAGKHPGSTGKKANSSGLGLQLVAMLTRQLKGILLTENHVGTKVSIGFPC